MLVPLVGLLLAGLEGQVTPVRWRAPGFGRRVDQVRSHLEPIHGTDMLAESFSREAAPDESIRLAYAIRWLELAETRSIPGWPELLTAG